MQKTRHKMRLLHLLILALATTLATLAQPKHEVRAVWLTTIGGIDWPHSYAQSARSVERQKDELRAILDKLQRANINTVLLQTRIRGTVIYPSAYEPWDGCLSGKPGTSPGYDALRFAIDECHRRGMELHAWVVTIPVGKWNALGCRRLREKMPRAIKKIGADGYMSPEDSQTASYLADICAEITANYDIDGIHLDYIRYPETWTLKVSRQQGRDNITRIVRAISARVKRLKPWVKMSCSPIGKADDLPRQWSHGWNAYTTVCQDAQGWLREGIMDALFPMMYFRGNQFYPFALDWKEQSCGRMIVPGLGIYFMSPKEKNWPLDDITRELETLRAYGMGHAYFRSKFFTDDTKGIYSFAREQFCQYPALVPPMTWQDSSKPAMPSALRRKDLGNGATVLEWQHADNDSTMTMFNVYSSHDCPVNTDDAANLIAMRLQSRHLAVPADPTRHYAITATNRYGNESRPLQEWSGDSGHPGSAFHAAGLLPCNGKTVHMPHAARTADAGFAIVETLQGTIVATMPYSTARLNIESLPEGIYTLRSLGKKGITHRLGFFMIKRKAHGTSILQ